MNAFVRKEIRLLLPSWSIGLLLTFSVWLIPSDVDSTSGIGVFLVALPFLLCPAMLVKMTLDSFGGELSAGTFSNLLAQPISRNRIWWTKTALLAAATALLFGVWWFSLVVHVPGALVTQTSAKHDMFVGSVMLSLVAYSGGLWTVLLLRQVAAALWFTLLAPVAVLMVIMNLLGEDPSPGLEEKVGIIVIVIYSLAGFFWARWMFLRAQDVQWTGGEIALPEMRWLKWWGERPREPRTLSDVGSLVASPHRTWRPRMALLGKEFQLHQSQFVIAGVLVLLHLGVILWRHLKSDLAQHPELELILGAFWVLWLVMPLLVGCAAVAEERKIGTLEGQLCLPVKRRTQFALKLFVVLFLSVLLGAVMPLLLEGKRIFPDARFHLDLSSEAISAWMPGSVFWQTICYLLLSFIDMFGSWMPLIILVGICVSVAALSFYASSLARNTLQALGPAVLSMLAAWFLLHGASHVEEIFHYPLWRGVLIYVIAVPVLPLVLAGLAFWNYKRVFLGWNVWRRNLLVLAASLALVMTATTAIYHRAWERLTPLEPPHGAARLTLVDAVELRNSWPTSVRLPDGRIWLDYFDAEIFQPNPLALLLGNIKLISLTKEHFLDGSNWVTITRGLRGRQMVGIKTDGTLWISEKPVERAVVENGRPAINQAKLVQFGNETNWRSVSRGNSLSALLLKNDGTLWRWGVTTNFDFKHNKWPGLQAFTPHRLGTESNWSEFFQIKDYFRAGLLKTDGSVWLFDSDIQNQTEEKIELAPGTVLKRMAGLKGNRLLASTEAWPAGGVSFRAGVRSDGTFRIWANQQFNSESRHSEWTATDKQFGSETNWLAVAGRGENIVTLKRDGSLWLWHFQFDQRRGRDFQSYEQEILRTTPVRLGTHTDWVAIDEMMGGIASLAADGSLWFWRFELIEYSNALPPLLGISRKPQRIAGLFDKAD